MLEMVSKEMSQMTSLDKTRMQTIEIANRGFHKVNCTMQLAFQKDSLLINAILSWRFKKLYFRNYI